MSQQSLLALSKRDLLPTSHKKYLATMRDVFSVHPQVVYDIGASVLHWYRAASDVWPRATFVAFEAMKECEFLYQQEDIQYSISVLGSPEMKDHHVEFWCNPEHPGGSSYFKENTKYSGAAEELYAPVKRGTCTLDEIVSFRGLQKPNLVKMDVQGAELEIIKGGLETLQSCRDLILELQHVEYNMGAPLKDEVVSYLDDHGFMLLTPLFSNNGFDGDYHFRNTRTGSKLA